MSGKDRTTFSLHEGTTVGQRWAHDDYYENEDRSTDFDAGLTSLGFIRTALRRSVWLLCTFAFAGLLVASGLYLAAPPTYQASATLFLSPRPNEDPGSAILDDQAIAQSRAVAELTIHKLGLQQSISSFLSAYTATVVTNRVLVITVTASSSNQAVLQAHTVAMEFLQFRANQLQSEQSLLLGSLNQQIHQIQQHIASITRQIDRLSALHKSPAQWTQLNNLTRERTALIAVEQSTYGTESTTQVDTRTAMRGSQVLAAASPLPVHSRLKHLILYAMIGLIAGLALGFGIVVIRALTSDRLYRRDDIARALGAPVNLSVGAVRISRWLPGRRGLAIAGSINVRRIVAHLVNIIAHISNAVAADSRAPASLAIVTVDDVHVPAVCLVSLAMSYAKQGLRVVVTDLCDGSPAARLLGTSDPGVQEMHTQGADLVVAIPDPDAIAPVGPLRRRSRQLRTDEPLAVACASADLLLTLVTLDPSLGGEHLSTWATDAVVMMTAGRSSWTMLHAVGEMIRLSNTRLVSGVLIGTDKTDDSLGLTHPPEVGRDAKGVEESLGTNGDGIYKAATQSPGSRRTRGR